MKIRNIPENETNVPIITPKIKKIGPVENLSSKNTPNNPKRDNEIAINHPIPATFDNKIKVSL